MEVAKEASCDARENRILRAMEEYTAALHTGQRPDRKAFLARHADIASELAECIEGLDFVHQAADNLSQPGGTGNVLIDAEVRPASPLGDYEIVRELGRGGMGVVYEAVQLSLGRRVALKVLPFAATMDPRHLQRFRNEARAAASLEHPHIVPVYGVGCERGVHYYAMKFIDGQSLASLLHARGADAGIGDSQSLLRKPLAPASGERGWGKGARIACAVPLTPDPSPPEYRGRGETYDSPSADARGSPEARTTPTAAARTQIAARDAAAFRQLASWGIQAALALEHAHSVGVVHRDIKPANLMIDGQGTLWVTDYGLARTAAEAGLTMTGDVLGTLRYMSPEQALAKHGLVDHRTDIYSLGVTLYELLTGTPAVDGKDREEILNAITLQERRPPRAWVATIPRDLETIVVKAMEASPADRYATAQEMANDLERFLRDEPIRARRPALGLRLRKWGRRHRPLVASATATMLTLLLVAVVLAFAYQRRRAETEKGLTAALAQVETLVEEGDKLIEHPQRWQATARMAQAALERAEGLLATGAVTGSLARRVEGDRATVEAAVADSDLLIELNRIRLERAAFREFRKRDCARAYARLLAGYGLDPRDPELAGARISGSRLRDALLAALEDWWRVSEAKSERQQLEDVLQDADPTDMVRRRWHEAVRLSDRALLVKMATELATQRCPAAVLCSRAADLSSLKEWTAAERLLTAAQARDPGDFWLNHDLGNVIEEQGPARAEEAVRYLQAALALRTDSPAAYLNLALALEDKGDVEGAIRCCKAALDINPRDGYAHNNLGVLLMNKGDLDGAIVCYKKTIDIDPRDAYAHNNLGYVLRAKGKVDEAIACFKQAIEIDPRYDSPYENLADALESMGKLDEAISHLRRALQIDPTMAKAHSALGAILREKGEHEEAIACCKRAIELNPRDAYAYCNLGNSLKAKGRSEQAIASLQRAVAIKPTDAILYYYLGVALDDSGRLEEAAAACREGLRHDRDCPEVHCQMGHVLLHQGKFREALEAFRRGDALGRQRPGWSSPSAAWIREAEHWVVLESNLPMLLRGMVQPSDSAERLRVARMCLLHKKLYAAAARFFADAFVDQPKLAEDLNTQDRYQAARAAALAGCGQGKDAGGLADKDRALLRQQALAWLEADLAAYRRLLDHEPDKSAPLVRERMQHWQQDTDFASVRGPEALAKLREAERSAWQDLWSDLADVLTGLKAQATGTTSGPK
jgi:tetratricopeptide (TPR) repeat protein